MSMLKDKLKPIFLYVCILIVFSILYWACFHIPISFPVFTYKGIFLLGIVSFLLCITLFLFKRFLFPSLDTKDIVIVLLIFTFVHLLVFCMVPVTIERAFSVFLLSEISQQENQEISLEETENIFIEQFVKTHGAFSKRFEEQIVTGTLVETDSQSYQLTPKGNWIVALFHMFDRLYHVQSPLL